MLSCGNKVAAEGKWNEVAFHTEATSVTEGLFAVDDGEHKGLAVFGVLQGRDGDRKEWGDGRRRT